MAKKKAGERGSRGDAGASKRFAYPRKNPLPAPSPTENPLKKGCSPAAVSANIEHEMRKHPEMPQRQAVAIALSEARREGCVIPPGHSGSVHPPRRRRNPVAERYWHFAEMNEQGGQRDNFGPFDTKIEAERARQTMAHSGRRITPVYSFPGRMVANIPPHMRKRNPIASFPSREHISNFEWGWQKAKTLYRQGLTLEAITHRASDEYPDVGRGMVAYVETMSGWVDVGRREARAHAVPEARMERLIADIDPFESREPRRKNPIEVDEVAGPAYWASALVNGDRSGLEDAEIAVLDRWEAKLAEKGWYVVNVVEDSERFTNNYNRYSGDYEGPSGGDVVDYVVHRIIAERPDAGPSRREPMTNPISEPPFGEEEFEARLHSYLQIGDRQLRIRRKIMGRHGTVFVNFFNLPAGIGGAGGGAEAENNRMGFMINGFDPLDPHAPPPNGRVRIEQMVSALDRAYTLRAKTGSPDAIARYLADFLNRVVREVPPHYTHTRVS